MKGDPVQIMVKQLSLMMLAGAMDMWIWGYLDENLVKQ